MEELNLPSGKYSLIRSIKSDDKGNVCLAEHKTMGVKRIIKKAIGDGAYRKSLMKEAYILSRLKHPFIPAVCDIEETDGSFYIIEEYIEGKSLYDYIRENGIFEQGKGLEAGVKLAKIINFLHSDNSFRVCHLDIQPKNIIIKDNQIYLIDFGNAICSNDTVKSCIMATKGFAPPEQYMTGFTDNDGYILSADVYGFGAVLLYMYTGVYRESFESEEIEALLRDKGINDCILHIVSNALNAKAAWRQNTMGIICRQLDEAGTATRDTAKADTDRENTENKGYSYEKKPYIISVAGMDRGAGATYTAILLTALLREKGIAAIYEENHGRDTVRKLARSYSGIKYDMGCFVFKNITMKPKYNDNIRIHAECKVVVRDEGTLKEGKAAGEYLIVVAQADIMGWTALRDSLYQLEHETYAFGRNASVVLNRCNEETYKKTVALISYGDGYMESFVSPFCAKIQNFKGMEAILNRLLAELKKGENACEEKFMSDIHRGDTKHRNSLGKKRRG